MESPSLLHLLASLENCIPLWSWRYDEAFFLLESNCPDEEALRALFSPQAERLLSLHQYGLLPAIVTSPQGLAWAVAANADIHAPCLYYVLGPVRLSDLGSDAGHMPQEDARLPLLSIHELSRYASMLHWTLNGAVVPVHLPHSGAGTADNASTTLLLSRLQEKIRSGDFRYVDLMMEVLSDRHFIHSLGAVTIDSAKYVSRLSMNLCCQTAVESGLSGGAVAALRGKYLPQILAASAGYEIAQISNIFLHHLVLLVRRANGSGTFSSPIHACCTYIEEHVCDKLSLSLLAKQVGYSPDHLSRKFRDEVGEPLKNYILRTKVHRAQLLLTTTTLPIGDIASTLSFCSVSHFTQVFRQFVGKTPADYRSEHAHTA